VSKLCNFYRVMPYWRGICRRCVSICLSQVDVLLKRLNVGSCKQCHTTAQELYFSGAEDLSRTQTESPDAEGVG